MWAGMVGVVGRKTTAKWKAVGTHGDGFSQTLDAAAAVLTRDGRQVTGRSPALPKPCLAALAWWTCCSCSCTTGMLYGKEGLK